MSWVKLPFTTSVPSDSGTSGGTARAAALPLSGGATSATATPVSSSATSARQTHVDASTRVTDLEAEDPSTLRGHEADAGLDFATALRHGLEAHVSHYPLQNAGGNQLLEQLEWSAQPDSGATAYAAAFARSAVESVDAAEVKAMEEKGKEGGSAHTDVLARERQVSKRPHRSLHAVHPPRKFARLEEMVHSQDGGLSALLKVGDLMPFYQAEVRHKEVCELQGRWATAGAIGACSTTRRRTLEVTCPFLTYIPPVVRDGSEKDGESSDTASSGAESLAEEGAGPGCVSVARRLPGHSIAGRTKAGICPYHVRISLVDGQRELKRSRGANALEIEDNSSSLFEPRVTTTVTTTAVTTVTTTSVTVRTDEPECVRAELAGRKRKRKKPVKSSTVAAADRTDGQAAGDPAAQVAVCEVAHLRHTCNPHVLKKPYGYRTVVDTDGSRHAWRATAYSAAELGVAIGPEMEQRGANLNLDHVHDALALFVKRSTKEYDAVRGTAANLLSNMRNEKRIAPEWQLRYMQAYCKELQRLGHHAVPTFCSAKEYHARQKRKALAAHAGQVRACPLAPKDFNEKAFLELFPLPADDDPDRCIGFRACPAYVLNDKGAWPDVRAMDVGGGRGRSPYNAFTVDSLDGNHNVHCVYFASLVDAESKLAWTPLLMEAIRLFPAMDAHGCLACSCDTTTTTHHFSAAVPTHSRPSSPDPAPYPVLSRFSYGEGRALRFTSSRSLRCG